MIAAAITSQRGKTDLPTHIRLNAAATGLSRDSIVLLEQVRTLDKHRLREHMGRLGEEGMAEVDRALSVSFGLSEQPMHNHSHIANMPAAAAQISHGACYIKRSIRVYFAIADSAQR